MGPPASPHTSSSRAKPVRRLPRPWQVRDDEEDGDESQDEIDLLTIPASQPAPAKRISSESKRAETPAPVRHDEPLPTPVEEGAGTSASQTTQRSVPPSQQTPTKSKRPKSKQAEASVPVRGDDSSQQTPAKRIKRLASGSKQAEALPGVDEPLPTPMAGDTGATASQASLSLVAPSQQTSAQRTRSESQWDETSPACQDDLLPAPVAGHTRRSPSEESQSSASPQPTSAEGMRAGSQQAEALAVHHDEPLPAPAAGNIRPGPSQQSQSSVAPVQLTASPPTPEQSMPRQSPPEQAAAQQKRSESQQAEAPTMRRDGQLTRSSPSQRDQSSVAPLLPALAQGMRPPSSSQPAPVRPPSSSQPTSARLRSSSQPTPDQSMQSRSQGDKAHADRRDGQVRWNPRQESASSLVSGYLEAVLEPPSSAQKSEYFVMPTIHPPERWERKKTVSPERTGHPSPGGSTDSSLSRAGTPKRKAAALAEEKTRSLMVNYARLAARKGDDYTVVRVQRRPGTAIDVDAEDASVIGPGTRRLPRKQPASNQLSPRSFGPALPSELDAHASSSLASVLVPTIPSADASLEALALADANGLAEAWLLISQTHTHVQLLNDRLQSTLSSLGISRRNDGSRLNAYKKQADRGLRWANALARQIHIALRTGAKSIEVCQFPEAAPRQPRRTASQTTSQTASQTATLQSSQLLRTQ